jgi:hypothetical protein
MALSIKNGTRYKAKVTLTYMESFASNATIAEKFKEAGFEDVTVVGKDYERLAEGTWTGADVADASDIIPSQVSDIEEVV